MPPAGDNHPLRFLCLTGFMGCGKSTVARLLARQAGWHYVDLDKRIIERAGLSIPEIFRQHGEPAFRDLEYEELGRILGEGVEQNKRCVVALGGGTIAQPRNLARLREAGCVIVWLHCPIEELFRRCARITNRPLFRDEDSFRQLYEERRPFYEQADHRVESAVEPLRVVEQILKLGILERVPA
jgi:shikimate kinase